MKRRMVIGFVLGLVFGTTASIVSLDGGIPGSRFARRTVDRIADKVSFPGSIVIWIVPGWPTKEGSSSEFSAYMVATAVIYASGGALVAWYFRKRSTSSHSGAPRCEKCGYSLIGNRSGVCPECGRVIHWQQASSVESRGMSKSDRTGC